MGENDNNDNIANNGANNYGNKNAMSRYKDEDGNEITPFAKYLSGFFLIGLTIFAALYLIGHWPDRLASPRDHIKPLYTYKWFHVRLVEIPDTGTIRYFNDSTAFVEEVGRISLDAHKKDTIPRDSTTNKVDTGAKGINADNRKTSVPVTTTQAMSNKKYPPEESLVHINTILLILVAVAGFLGNMIYVATSFTTFLGNGQYKKSWGLWYYVKPFTASALALTIYFVFRGGFLNMSDESTNINIYGLMTISILAGLFTDRTTLKLKEVFDVILNPKEERKDKLLEEKAEVSNVEAPELEPGKVAVIKIAGKNFDKKKLTIKIDDKESIATSKQPDLITINYAVPPDLKDKDSVKLEIIGEDGKPAYGPINLKIKKESSADASASNEGGESVPVETGNQENFGDPDAPDDVNTPQE